MKQTVQMHVGKNCAKCYSICMHSNEKTFERRL